MSRRYWSRGTVICEIRKRRRKGLSLSGKTVHDKDGPLYQNARIYFGIGGWRKALRAAGYSERNAFRRQPYWTKKLFKETLRYLRRSGIPIHEQYLRKNGFRSVFEAGIALYGTWRKAIESIGVRYESVSQKRRYYWNREKVIAEIRRLKQCGVPLNYRFIIAARGDLYGAAYLHCDGWPEAVAAAGFDYLKECKQVPTRRWLQSLSDGEVETLHQTMMECAQERRRHVKREHCAR